MVPSFMQMSNPGSGELGDFPRIRHLVVISRDSRVTAEMKAGAGEGWPPFSISRFLPDAVSSHKCKAPVSSLERAVDLRAEARQTQQPAAAGAAHLPLSEASGATYCRWGSWGVSIQHYMFQVLESFPGSGIRADCSSTLGHRLSSRALCC